MSQHLVFGAPATALLFALLGLALRRTRHLYVEAEQRREAEEALRQAQKMEAVGQLTGGVAHDFNNMLTIIRSSTDLLRRQRSPGGSGGGAHRRHCRDGAARRQADRAAPGVRAAAIAEAGNVRRWRAHPGRHRHAAGADGGARARSPAQINCERCSVEADMSQFETALVNMAVNARDAMPDGGTLTMRVEEVARIPGRGRAAAAGRLRRHLAHRHRHRDSGRQAGARIFEPFFTTKQIGKGTGLGLSQVYGFAQQSGGDVSGRRARSGAAARSRSTCRVSITPPRPIAAPREAGAARALAGGAGAACSSSRTMSTWARSRPDVLQDLGYETTWAANADAGAGAGSTAEAAFDVVFSDVVMPGMSGVELGHEIRRRHPDLPVLLTSGYSEALAEKGRHGFELLQKPYSIEQLSGVLHRVGRLRKVRRANEVI